jgi:hypothetical protein
MRSVMDYGCPIHYPNLSATSLNTLQVIQNSAFRTVTGCHLKSPIPFLHSECGELMVKDHLELLCAQYLASAMRPSHPSHDVVTSPAGPRHMKETLHSKCIDLVEPHLTGGLMLEINYKKSIDALHSSAVTKAICAAGPNVVLGRHPPKFNPEELTLSRAHRCAIRQLKSGYCHRLNTYLHSIGKAVNDLCPECGIASHTTAHIFQCRSFPTDLILDDLWLKPREVAQFLSSLPFFIRHLPPVAPLPRRVPPGPPP